MGNRKALDHINAEIGILEVQRELMESEEWDDKTHLERKFPMHLHKFDRVIHNLCNSVGVERVGEINDQGVFRLKQQTGESYNFDISRDYAKTRGEDKLVSYIEFNEKTKAHVLLHYSPTKGVGFEYAANLLPKNVQLGKGDFFGKNIESMIKKIDSATEGVKFWKRFERYDKEPNGIKEFAISSEDFVKGDEKQWDVISIIAFLDGLVRGMRDAPFWVYGENFKHEKEGPLFKIGMKFTI